MRISLLSIEGKTYPLVFSLNAAEQIEDEYSGHKNGGLFIGA